MTPDYENSTDPSPTKRGHYDTAVGLAWLVLACFLLWSLLGQAPREVGPPVAVALAIIGFDLSRDLIRSWTAKKRRRR